MNSNKSAVVTQSTGWHKYWILLKKIKLGVCDLLCCDGPHEFCNNKQSDLQQHHDSLRTDFKK